MALFRLLAGTRCIGEIFFVHGRDVSRIARLCGIDAFAYEGRSGESVDEWASNESPGTGNERPNRTIGLAYEATVDRVFQLRRRTRRTISTSTSSCSPDSADAAPESANSPSSTSVSSPESTS